MDVWYPTLLQTLICVAVLTSSAHSRLSAQEACRPSVEVYNTRSAIRFEELSVPSPGADTSADKTTVSTGVGVSTGNHTVRNSNFNSIDVSNTTVSPVSVAVNDPGEISLNDLNVSSQTPVRQDSPPPPINSRGDDTSRSTPLAAIDPRSGKVWLSGLREVGPPDVSIAVVLEALTGSFRFCATRRGEANVFISGDPRETAFQAAESDLLLWYYDSAESLPDRWSVGSILQPGIEAKDLKLRYLTSELEFHFPLNGSLLREGSVIAVPEPRRLLLTALQLLACCGGIRAREFPRGEGILWPTAP